MWTRNSNALRGIRKKKKQKSSVQLRRMKRDFDANENRKDPKKRMKRNLNAMLRITTGPLVYETKTISYGGILCLLFSV